MSLSDFCKSRILSLFDHELPAIIFGGDGAGKDGKYTAVPVAMRAITFSPIDIVACNSIEILLNRRRTKDKTLSATYLHSEESVHPFALDFIHQQSMNFVF